MNNFDNAAQKQPPETPLIQRKEILWKQMTTELSQITDNKGLGIDKGIMNTVVALSVHGINTRQSCEGHLENGTGAPWIDIE